MTPPKKLFVGLGEILWDLLPQGKLLGGAPANFAFHAAQLGDEGLPASRVGIDPLGDEILARVRELGLPTEYIQRDPSRATGTVKVDIGPGGQPSYTIVEGVAWDGLEWTPAWEALALRADAVCFGSLAQRAEPARGTIRRFLETLRPEALPIFDINLRQHYYSAETLRAGLDLCRVAKMNDEELPVVTDLLGLGGGDEEARARAILRAFDLELLCVTRGARGSLLLSEREISSHPGFPTKVADTVGAGDAFVAAVARHWLLGSPLAKINEAANRLGAFVASRPGATPELTREILADVSG